MIEEVGSKVDLFQDPGVEKVLYMYLLSVRREYCNRGIGKKLVQVSVMPMCTLYALCTCYIHIYSK